LPYHQRLLLDRADLPQLEAKLAHQFWLAGDRAEARRMLKQAHQLVLVGVGDLALRSGDPAEAARLLGAADAIRGSTDRSVPDVDRIETEARATLGDAGYQRAYAAGSDVTVATAVAAAGLTLAA
jgi:hypothetical protein